MKALMIRFAVCCFLLLALWLAVKVGAIEWGTQKIMGSLVKKDATQQTTALANKLIDSPHCAPFRETLLRAGKGAPAEGTTQHKILLAYEAAKTAGCKKIE